MPSPTTGAGPSMSVAALALSAPDRTAVVDASRRITWAELARLVSDRTASLLQPAPGRPAFLIPKPDLNGLVDILAHWEAHIPAVLVSPKLTSAEQDALKSHADSIAEPLPDGTAFVVFTSGTTGLPKPAILTRESLTAGARAMIRALRMTSSDVLQLSLSPARVGGLGIIMRTLAAGSTIALSPGFSGARFPEPLARDGVTFASLVVGMPDEKWGQIVTALLVSDTDPHPQSDAIVCGLAARLARWKSPRRIAWVSSLPFTSAGKRSRNPEVLRDLEFDVLHYRHSPEAPL